MTQLSQRVSQCLTESPGEAVNEAVNPGKAEPFIRPQKSLK
jgi:hypothetical protein